MQVVYEEENRQYRIVFPVGMSPVDLDRIYAGSGLKSVDILVETDESLIFMEYKNSTIPRAANPKTFDEKLKSDEHSMVIARKYYDSLLYALAKGLTNKRLYYHYVVEAATLDSVSRKLLADRLKKKLPFQLQDRMGTTLISDFTVDALTDWNARYPQFTWQPIQKKP